jgi:hypothetical protein
MQYFRPTSLSLSQIAPVAMQAASACIALREEISDKMEGGAA